MSNDSLKKGGYYWLNLNVATRIEGLAKVIYLTDTRCSLMVLLAGGGKDTYTCRDRKAMELLLQLDNIPTQEDRDSFVDEWILANRSEADSF